MSVGERKIGKDGECTPTPAQSAPISPRAAVLEAARICEAAALNIGDKYYPTMNKNCAKALRALADTMPDESEYICKCGIRVVPHRCKVDDEF